MGLCVDCLDFSLEESDSLGYRKKGPRLYKRLRVERNCDRCGREYEFVEVI